MQKISFKAIIFSRVMALFILATTTCYLLPSPSWSRVNETKNYDTFQSKNRVSAENNKKKKIEEGNNTKKIVSKDKIININAKQLKPISHEFNSDFFWSEPSFYVAVLSILVAALIFLLGGSIIYELWTKKITNNLVMRVKQQLLTELALPIQSQVAINEVVYDINLKAFSKLTDFYRKLWAWFSSSTEERTISEDDRNIYLQRLYKVLQSFRLGLWHIQLFSRALDHVELAIREIQGISSIESLAPLRDFVLLRRQIPEFKTLTTLAERVIFQIEKIHT